MDTQQQSERDCGPRMTMYMVIIGEILRKIGSRFNFGILKLEIYKFLKNEKFIAKTATHSLAKAIRQRIHEMLKNKQIELKSIS